MLRLINYYSRFRIDVMKVCKFLLQNGWSMLKLRFLNSAPILGANYHIFFITKALSTAYAVALWALSWMEIQVIAFLAH